MAGLIIVTGAGRSGTSAVARVLHESGVRMGTAMAEASEANPEGFYEDLAVVDLNERVLTDVGLSDPWRPERWPSRASVRSVGLRYDGEMSSLAATGVDGWKDPRFAVTLEAWLPALTQQPRIVICLRSPRAYADSVTRIYGLVKHARAMREWARHYRRLLAVIRRHQIDATCIEYDALVEQPKVAVAALSAFVGRKLDASLVVPRLRREAGDIPPAYRALYDEVAALGDGPAPKSVIGPKPASSPRTPTPDYERRAEEILASLSEAKATWQSVAPMPWIKTSSKVRKACDDYTGKLIDLQQRVVALVPQGQLARQHKRLVRLVNVNRMIAQLAASAAATGDRRTRDAAVSAWQKYGSSSV